MNTFTWILLHAMQWLMSHCLDLYWKLKVRNNNLFILKFSSHEKKLGNWSNFYSCTCISLLAGRQQLSTGFQVVYHFDCSNNLVFSLWFSTTGQQEQSIYSYACAGKQYGSIEVSSLRCVHVHLCLPIIIFSLCFFLTLRITTSPQVTKLVYTLELMLMILCFIG
jgi:hypothetical protein